MRFSLRSSSPIRTGIVCFPALSPMATYRRVPAKTSFARRRSTSVHRRGRARRALPATFPASTLRRCPRRHAARASPIVLRRTPPRTPSRWFIHHVSTPAATSRRSPIGVGRDITSPSTATITREMPVHPDPQAPPTRTSRSSSTSCPARRPSNAGVVRLRADETERGRRSPAHHAGVDVAALPNAPVGDPCISFGVTPTTMCSPSDCTSDTPTVDVVRACTLRRTSSRLAGPDHCRLSGRYSTVGSQPVVGNPTGRGQAPRSRRYPLPSASFARTDAQSEAAGVQDYADDRAGRDAGRVPIDGGGVVGDRDEGAGHSGCARADLALAGGWPGRGEGQNSARSGLVAQCL